MSTSIIGTLRRKASLFATVGVLALVGVSCGDSAGPETGVDVQDVAFDADELLGEEVTVSAEVLDVVSDEAFWLGGDDFGTSAVLVVNAAGTTVQEDQVVQVTGTVREFEEDAFVEDFGFEDDVFDDEELFGGFVGQPVIVAEQIDQSVPAEDAVEDGDEDGATAGTDEDTTD